MDEELTRYINDHLAGASGALLVVGEIGNKHDDPEARAFFLALKEKIAGDRGKLEWLLRKIDEKPSALLKAAGAIGARLGGIKLLWEKVEPGKLRMFEALEMLALGIQGKRLLWIVMQRIQPWFPEWEGLDFQKLEMEALHQRDAVEEYRLSAAHDSLVGAERRSSGGKHP